MKKILGIGIGLVLSLPLLCAAVVVDSTGDTSVSTGGMSASGGATSSGSSDASVDIRTVMQGSGNGGSVQSTITTVRDGVSHTESIRGKVPSNTTVAVYVGTSTRSGNADIRARVRANTKQNAHPTDLSDTGTAHPQSQMRSGSGLLLFLKNLFAFFHF